MFASPQHRQSDRQTSGDDGTTGKFLATVFPVPWFRVPFRRQLTRPHRHRSHLSLASHRMPPSPSTFKDNGILRAMGSSSSSGIAALECGGLKPGKISNLFERNTSSHLSKHLHPGGNQFPKHAAVESGLMCCEEL